VTLACARVEGGLERVLGLAAARLEGNGLRAIGRVRIDRVTAEEVRALSGLLGTRWRAVLPGASTSVSLTALDDALRASSPACALAEAAAAARGRPLVDRTAVREAETGARERGWAQLAGHPALARHAHLAQWLEHERATGAAKRTARAAGLAAAQPFGLLAGALDLLAHLPAEPPQTLARFAATRCAGDPHALDRGRPLDTILARGLAHLDGDDEPAAGAEARRERYDRWGLGCDELSSTVLCAGVRPTGAHPLALALRASADAGQPRVVTLRELRDVDTLGAGADVFCCENPDVVAGAADELASGCPPLVCTGGWPSTAALRLLRALAAGGATVHHHGDMDLEGLRILDRVLAITGGGLWRMGAADHAAAAFRGAVVAPFAMPADLRPELRAIARSLQVHARAVREEQVLADLLEDLRAVSRAA
jgi:uncharacterized protein (TIGR02679 family)